MGAGNILKRRKHVTWPLGDVRSEAISVAGDGSLLDQSPSAVFLAAAWCEGCEGLRSFARNSAAGTPICGDTRALSVGSETRRYQLTLAPTSADTLVIVGRDITLMESMTTALVHSRSLLQDLVRRGSDFGFETDTMGRFVYVGPDDALGHRADEITGKNATGIFFEGGECPLPINPFEALTHNVQEAVPLIAADGSHRVMWISSSPHKDADGIRRGARGIVRDVTASYVSGKANRQESVRLAMLNRITRLMRAADNVATLSKDALGELAGALRADTGWICIGRLDEAVPLAALDDEDSVLATDQVMAALQASPEWQLGREQHFSLTVGDCDVLSVMLEVEAGQKGAILLARDTEHFPWSEGEHQLLESVVDHFAVALRQAYMIEELERLSSTDELSGLLNRRAFNNAVSRRLAVQKRSGNSGCYLYVDMDHFKEVNDRLGHAAGDMVIARFGDFLRQTARESDIVARLGGDEFGLWLDGVGLDGAAVKARRLLDFMGELRRAAGDESLRLSLSIGIAHAAAMENYDVDSLSAAADSALYKAKESGRSTFEMAMAGGQRK